MYKKISLFIPSLVIFTIVYANQIDVGIFESQTVTDQIEVKIRPDFNIQSNQTVTGLLYTVRWNEPSVSISTQYFYPFFIAPQGSPVLYNGYYYQVFAAVPLTAVPIDANEEFLISTFTYTNGGCAIFEIIEDEWTQANNGNVYFEFIGVEVTGIVYEPNLFLGSYGGSVQGNDSIFLGNSTGPMNLLEYSGTILSWQCKINDNEWADISGTSGLSSYNETPSAMGSYSYRVRVQKGVCPEVYSDSLHLLVVANLAFDLKVYLEGPYVNGEMKTLLNQQAQIPLTQPFAGPPWNYSGTESVASLPNNEIVDWILVDVRETDGDVSAAGSDKSIFKQAGFLLKTGQIKMIDGNQNINFIAAITKNIYISIWHRNHLSVLSNYPLTNSSGTYYYNFSSGEMKTYGGGDGHKEIAPGIWGMFSGDGNSDGYINVLDKNTIWPNQAGFQGYHSFDFNLDIQTDNQDKNDYWLSNAGQESQVPE